MPVAEPIRGAEHHIGRAGSVPVCVDATSADDKIVDTVAVDVARA
jgi:hypothetical protein